MSQGDINAYPLVWFCLLFLKLKTRNLQVSAGRRFGACVLEFAVAGGVLEALNLASVLVPSAAAEHRGVAGFPGAGGGLAVVGSLGVAGLWFVAGALGAFVQQVVVGVQWMAVGPGAVLEGLRSFGRWR